MTRDEFDVLGIPSQCRQPDPLACYERQTLPEQSDAGPCLFCPVASWIEVMVLSGRWMDGSVGVEEVPTSARWFEPKALERAGEGIAVQDAGLGLAA